MVIEWNKVYYVDCMNHKIGLPSLPGRSIDLCLTDPPYNVNAKVHSQKDSSNPNWRTQEQIGYNDNIEDYFLFSIRWFYEIKRICNALIFTPGNQNLGMWYKIQEPKALFFQYKRNAHGRTQYARFNSYEAILFYGNLPTTMPFTKNVFDIPILSGFLKRKGIIHPHPKALKLWTKILTRIKPQSVIDPFLGSGTTAEVCTKLGIKWLGYEINEIYSQDINRRLKNLKREPKQIDLLNY